MPKPPRCRPRTRFEAWSRFRLARVALAAAFLLTAFLPSNARAEDGQSVIACYDATRQLVTHTLPGLCKGEIVSEERAAAIAAARRLELQSEVDRAGEADPVTGTRRLIGTGSGFFIGSGGEILTNAHVVDRCAMLTAQVDGGAKLAAPLVASAKAQDLALLRTGTAPARIARFTRKPAAADRTLAIVGYPAYGLPTRLSVLTPAQTNPRRLAALAGLVPFYGEVRHGNSGSPLLDDRGSVLGIVKATVDTPGIFRATGRRVTDIGFAVPEAVVLDFLARQGVKPRFDDDRPPYLTAEQLHALARGFVVRIGCWK